MSGPSMFHTQKWRTCAQGGGVQLRDEMLASDVLFSPTLRTSHVETDTGSDAQIISPKRLQLPSGEAVTCDCRGCFDLAAVRGLTNTRGRASAICGCAEKAGRQKLPGDGIYAEIPEGDSVEVWKAAEKILCGGCSYDSD